jgi:hypothetical protein
MEAVKLAQGPSCNTSQGSPRVKVSGALGEMAKRMMLLRRNSDRNALALKFHVHCLDSLCRFDISILFYDRIRSSFGFPMKDICRFEQSRRAGVHEGSRCSVVQGASRWGASVRIVIRAGDCCDLIVGLRARAGEHVSWSRGG